MFQIKSEEIEVTDAMVGAGAVVFWQSGAGDNGALAGPLVTNIYRAMEQARRDAQIGIVWGEPNDG